MKIDKLFVEPQVQITNLTDEQKQAVEVNSLKRSCPGWVPSVDPGYITGIYQKPLNAVIKAPASGDGDLRLESGPGGFSTQLRYTPPDLSPYVTKNNPTIIGDTLGFVNGMIFSKKIESFSSRTKVLEFTFNTTNSVGSFRVAFNTSQGSFSQSVRIDALSTQSGVQIGTNYNTGAFNGRQMSVELVRSENKTQIFLTSNVTANNVHMTLTTYSPITIN